MTQKRNLVARVIKQRRVDAERNPEPAPAPERGQRELDALEARVDRLEARLAGLQDSVHARDGSADS